MSRISGVRTRQVVRNVEHLVDDRLSQVCAVVSESGDDLISGRTPELIEKYDLFGVVAEGQTVLQTE